MTFTQLASGFRNLLVFIAMIILLALPGCDSPAPPQNAEPVNEGKTTGAEGVIVAMGDSLTAGLGVAPTESYPAQLEKLLAERGLNYRVGNAGISGETSSGAKARIDWVLRLNPAVVILETGANDGLRGIDPKLVEENVEQIIVRLKQEEITVVLTGMMMLTNLGKTYVTAFNDLYPRLARQHEVVFMPFFLKDVAAEPTKNQADGIHPNPAGYQIIAANLLPYVEKAIQIASD
ncbi:MAG: arylesterase [Desulfofustis sp.]|nr:arylesterase [Desulfofustis sp.]